MIRARRNPQPGTAPSTERKSAKPKYEIKEELESKYANIYSLISAIEVLEDEYCNGNVGNAEHTRLFTDLYKQFSRVQQALGLNRKDVQDFCTAAGLSHGYAISAIFNQSDVDVDSKSDKIQEGLLLGADFTTLSDWCYLRTGDASSLLTLVRTIKRRLENLGILQKNQEVKEITDKWIDRLNELPLKMKVPPEILDELQGDVGIWRMTVHDTLRV